jgi:hypothetical protein
MSSRDTELTQVLESDGSSTITAVFSDPIGRHKNEWSFMNDGGAVQRVARCRQGWAYDDRTLHAWLRLDFIAFL